MGINGTSSHVNIFTPQFIASFSYFKIIEVFIFYFSHWTLYFFQFHSYKLQLHGFTCWDRFLSACSCIWIKKNPHRDLWPSGICMSVTPAVSYLPTRLAGCSVGPGISYGTYKLTRTPWVKKKKKKKKKPNSASLKSLHVSWNIPTCSGWRKNSQACGLERTTSTALYIRKTWENNVHS